MDPDANLTEMRELASTLADVPERPTDAARLAELVQAMDEWLCKGGFRPLAWTLAPTPVPEPRRCPDDGACHHECATTECYRVRCCPPLGAAGYPRGEWPAEVVAEFGAGDELRAALAVLCPTTAEQHRYHNDAEYHAEVYRAAQVAVLAMRRLRDERTGGVAPTESDERWSDG